MGSWVPKLSRLFNKFLIVNIKLTDKDLGGSL
jgi:hypothetical protein